MILPHMVTWLWVHIATNDAELCQKVLNVNLPYRGSTGPLNLLIDCTGIKSEGEGEWNARKHGGPKWRIWRKIHIGIDEETLEVRVVEVTTNNVGNALMLPELLNKSPTIRTLALWPQSGFVTRESATMVVPMPSLTATPLLAYL